MLSCWNKKKTGSTDGSWPLTWEKSCVSITSGVDRGTHTEHMLFSFLRDLDEHKILSNLHIFIRQDKMEKEIVWLFEDIFLRESH